MGGRTAVDTCSFWLARNFSNLPVLGSPTREVVWPSDARATVALPWKAQWRLLRSLYILRERRGARGSLWLDLGVLPLAIRVANALLIEGKEREVGAGYSWVP